MGMAAEQARRKYWAKYYAGVAESGRPALDLSNRRVQAQSFALTLEVLGDCMGSRCLDVGCGRGELSKCLADLGASQVTGLDVVPRLIEAARASRDDVRWICGSVDDEAALDTIGLVDRIALIEVLQYLPSDRVLRILWAHLAPGGRMVGIVPNANCPIVKSTVTKFGGQYVPLTQENLRERLAMLPELDASAIRGFVFLNDQRLLPYEVTPWDGTAGSGSIPNRLQFVAQKQGIGRLT
jgi:2-polyprenyl-3-methyl-5-hydroxy-6-metoxy-1,4-benzoquinol methylase